LTGPVPSLSPQDSNDQDRAWNSDDERDYADQQSPPPSPMAHYPGLQDPLARFLSTVPDWRVLDKVALENAIKGLPIPVVGPAPPGISLQDAIKVKQHDFYYTMSYTTSYTMSHTISHTISYTTSYTISHTISNAISFAGRVGASFATIGGGRSNFQK
jgi:hypothetical protein